MTKGRRKAIVWIAVLGGLALLQSWIAARRPPPPELRATREFLVTTVADAGPGSLREAIFAVAGVDGRARIRLPARRIVLETPLPPVVNRHGVVIEGTPGTSEIDAARLEPGVVLDLDAPDSFLHGVTIANAPGDAVLVRKNGMRVVDSRFVKCDLALETAEDVENLVVERTTFLQNRIGVRLGAARGRTEIRKNRFSNHVEAGVWVVRRRQIGSPLFGEVVITGNRFDQDRISTVLANTPLLVEDNDFTGAREAAVVLLGEGAVVRRNRIRGGTGTGLVADDTTGVIIDNNEIDHNQTIGLLVRSSSDALVRSNRLYANGYGLAFVLGRPRSPSTGADNTMLRHTYDGVIVIGDSPVLRENQVLNGSLAGVRVLDFYSASGARTPSDPLLQGNRVQGNGIDETIRGEYRTPPERASR